MKSERNRARESERKKYKGGRIIGQFRKLNKELLFLAVFRFITNHKIEV